MTTTANEKSGKRDPKRAALGMALGAGAEDAARAALKAVEEHRTPRTNLTRKLDTLVVATLLISRWLITGESATESEVKWLGEVGEVSATDGTPLATTAKGAMAWRDFLLNVIEAEGARLECSRELIAEAMYIVRVSLDTNLILASRAYDANMTNLNAAFGYQALHDDLTGLPNRRLFYDRLSAQLLAAERMQRPSGVLLLDLDRFKEVNDTLGHEAGDQLLIMFAVRMREVLRASDTIGRLGGDEFAVLPADVQGMEGLVVAAKKILELAERPFEIQGTSIQVQASIGISVYPDHGSSVGTLMRRADMAMYVAKNSRSRYTVYSAEQEGQIDKRISLLGELRQAIARGELVVHFQPKIDIVSGRTSGVEALVRWAHPKHGLVAPEEFIPLAEEGELMAPLTRWVLNDTLRQMHFWQQEGIRVVGSVNLSATNLLEPDLADAVAGLLTTWEIEAGQLILELTESTLISRSVDQMLRSLRNLEVGLAIDDYGTGYSSLVHLRRLPLTELKLDQTFVRGITAVRKDQEIINATITLGHRLGLSVSAEGVADEATLIALAEYGCDSAQGFHIAPPMMGSEFSAWLAGSRWPAADFQPKNADSGVGQGQP